MNAENARRSGVRVCEWRGSGDDLEQIFLQSGAKELM